LQVVVKKKKKNKLESSVKVNLFLCVMKACGTARVQFHTLSLGTTFFIYFY